MPPSSPVTPEWTYATFDELSAVALYEILSLRQRVFVVEQQCPYLDADGADRTAVHLCGHSGGRLLAYLRFFAPNGTASQAVIGRVVVAPEVRGRGVARALMMEALRTVEARHPDVPIKVAAQTYLRAFYLELGFQPVSEPYDEDGIPHVDMLRSPVRS